MIKKIWSYLLKIIKKINNMIFTISYHMNFNIVQRL